MTILGYCTYGFHRIVRKSKVDKHKSIDHMNLENRNIALRSDNCDWHMGSGSLQRGNRIKQSRLS